jgi:hypothetical protein
MHTHKPFFRIFLVVYFLFLIYHATSIHFDSWIPVTALGIGILLSIMAHMRHGYGTIVLLLIHIILEWIEYTQHRHTFTEKELIFYTIHSVLDYIFLWEEVRTHARKWKYALGGSLVLLYLLIHMSGNVTATHNEHEHESSSIEVLVIGGMLGCTTFHLFLKRKVH